MTRSRESGLDRESQGHVQRQRSAGDRRNHNEQSGAALPGSVQTQSDEHSEWPHVDERCRELLGLTGLEVVMGGVAIPALRRGRVRQTTASECVSHSHDETGEQKPDEEKKRPENGERG